MGTVICNLPRPTAHGCETKLVVSRSGPLPSREEAAGRLCCRLSALKLNNVHRQGHDTWLRSLRFSHRPQYVSLAQSPSLGPTEVYVGFFWRSSRTFNGKAAWFGFKFTCNTCRSFVLLPGDYTGVKGDRVLFQNILLLRIRVRKASDQHTE